MPPGPRVTARWPSARGGPASVRAARASASVRAGRAPEADGAANADCVAEKEYDRSAEPVLRSVKLVVPVAPG